MIGMIALAGIIVRNSILLVDFINAEVARGVPFQEAVIALRRGARQAHRPDRAGRHARCPVHTR
jgi:multidrug efflux pump subunit AcrB